ncbi:transcriptional regulator with XRE-family HTH domain [Catenuloplanes nepalensis]|uniref:Transcriptional regulator with XRE-family HTH domain n=1 Tax=Catenuloplanes nepalensis TaxID=587533 RepID=A0ABT9MTP4_9ACTN|nr:helix-turn-helix transcriptional regulator [Catenuloplanes nepalensis]MDP9794391.1 transcriptional regulator with XRE-family HTH domain [Catenuloplanes nepalensis]
MTTNHDAPAGRDEPVGAVLARLRRERRLSGATLAAQVGMSQPKISRLERGVGSPDPRDVEVVARALGADEELVRELVQRTVYTQNRIMDWRLAPDNLASRQEIVADWETASEIKRELAVTVLPGLLQTSEYARAVLIALDPLIRSGEHPNAERTILAAVAARLKRQEILADPARRLHAVIAEIALRGPMCTPTEMLAQLAHLREMAALSNVTVEIIPDDADMPVPFLHGFMIFDDQLLLIDVYNTGLVSRGEKDIAFYRRVFDAVAAYATDDITPILDRHTRRCLERIHRELD